MNDTVIRRLGFWARARHETPAIPAATETLAPSPTRKERRATRQQDRDTTRTTRRREHAARRARRHETPAIPAHSTTLRAMRWGALTGVTGIVSSASAVSFAESYRGLYEWAAHHGITGFWASVWPLQIDTFIAVGELALFVALADRWDRRSRISAWTVTVTGLVVSVAGNVGHVPGHDLTWRVTAAVPPLAAAAALAVGLGVLKRIVAHNAPADPGADSPVKAAAPKRAAAAPKPRQPGTGKPGRPAAPIPDTAWQAFRASLESGQPMSARKLADEHLDGNRRAAAKVIAASQNGHGS